MRIEKVADTFHYEVFCGKGHRMSPQKSIDIAYKCPKCGETCSHELFDLRKHGGMN